MLAGTPPAVTSPACERPERQKRYEELDEAVRKYLAWKDIAGSEDRIRELDLSAQQAAQARKRLKDADETIDLRISTAYHWLLVPVQPSGQPVSLDEIKTDTAKDRLAERASDKLRSADMLRSVQGPQNIRLNLAEFLSTVWSCGHIAVGKLWEYYCQYAYLPRLAERSVLDRGILAVFEQMVWDHDGFAVASGYDEATGKYVGLAIPQENVPPQITDSTLLVRPDGTIAQRERERAEQEAARAAAAAAAAAAGTGADGDTDADAGTTASGAGGTASGGGSFPGPVADSGGSAPYGGSASSGGAPASPPATKNSRFYGTVRLDPERFGRDLDPGG